MTYIQRMLYWASLVTGESTVYDQRYYWTAPVKTALFRLTNYESYFIGLVGLIGTGKSSAVTALQQGIERKVEAKNQELVESEMEKENERRKAKAEEPISAGSIEWVDISKRVSKVVVAVKWCEDPWLMLYGSIEFLAGENYRNLVYSNLKDAPKARKIIGNLKASIRENFSNYGRVISEPEVEQRALARLPNEIKFEEAERMLPTKILDQIHHDVLDEFLNDRVDTLLIDMPDYSAKGSWKINKDLDSIGLLWNQLRKKGNTNILVCLQQELVMNQPHLILGKMDKIYLKPLTAEQLLEAYKQFFESFEPFTEDALRLVAKLSRGVFRRFKTYVRLCLEQATMEGLVSSEGMCQKLLTTELVRRAITKEQLKVDMDLGLSDVFKNEERKLQAFNILDFVSENSGVSQKTISEALSLHPNAVGDVVKQLCLHNYLQVKRGKGTELLVFLKE